MSTLSQTQITAYAASVGFTNPRLMAAIAMAESGGRTDVVNSIGCVGLWQINQPVHVKAHPSWSQAWLKVPLNNARAAKVIYNSQGLGAWEAYTNGAYKKYYGGTVVQASVEDDLGNLLAPGASQLGEALGSGTGSLAMVAKGGLWVSNPHNWVRVMYVVLGVGIAYIAVEKAFIANGPGKQLVKSFIGKKVPSNG